MRSNFGLRPKRCTITSAQKRILCSKRTEYRHRSIFLLDTDLEENDELARSTTQYLYGGNERTRLAQEIVLGIGGVRAFEALGIPIDLYHGQEGHSVMIALELLRKQLARSFARRGHGWHFWTGLGLKNYCGRTSCS